MVFKARFQVGNGSKKYSFQKIPFIIKTALKLAAINAYDDESRIRNRDGNFIPGTNVYDLLNHCMSVSRDLKAQTEFVDLLAEARIDPDWILNESIRNLLAAKSKRKPTEFRPHPSQTRKFTDLPPPTETVTLPDEEDDDMTETYSLPDMDEVGDSVPSDNNPLENIPSENIPSENLPSEPRRKTASAIRGRKRNSRELKNLDIDMVENFRDETPAKRRRWAIPDEKDE